MKKLALFGTLALIVALAASTASAEVMDVRVGGSIQIRGNVATPGFADPLAAISGFSDSIDGDDFYSQRTRINIDAQLTGNVRGFVELQSLDFWGVDDTEEVLNVVPTEFDSEEEVTLHQAYIEMNDVQDMPLRIRAGRQEMAYGREWLVGNNDAGVNFVGLAYDAIRLTYDTEDYVIDLWTAKLFDEHILRPGIMEEDGDVDFYGIYGTWKDVPDAVIDAYWLYLRAAADPLGFGMTETLQMHTLGARVAGTAMEGLLDYNVEAAFQTGDNGFDNDFDGLALNALAGYTLEDIEWTPRVSVEYVFFSGQDDFGDTETFQRLFSDVHYGELNLGGTFDEEATNLHIIRVGVDLQPTEKLALDADVLLFQLDEDGVLTQVFGATNTQDDDDVGMELDIVASYDYTEDLNLRLGWAHFFADDAIENSYGGGLEDDDVDYVYIQAKLTF